MLTQTNETSYENQKQVIHTFFNKEKKSKNSLKLQEKKYTLKRGEKK